MAYKQKSEDLQNISRAMKDKANYGPGPGDEDNDNTEEKEKPEQTYVTDPKIIDERFSEEDKKYAERLSLLRKPVNKIEIEKLKAQDNK